MKSWNTPSIESIRISKRRNTASTQKYPWILPSTDSIPEYRTPRYSKYSSIPQYWTPKYCRYGSVCSTESWNTASSSNIPQYTKPKYCEYMEVPQVFLLPGARSICEPFLRLLRYVYKALRSAGGLRFRPVRSLTARKEQTKAMWLKRTEVHT